MRVDELDFSLPDELIARHPTGARDGGRMMVVRFGQRSVGATDMPGAGERDARFEHSRIPAFAELIPAGAVLVLNDTKVIPARLIATKPTGGRVEILLTRRLDDAGRVWSCIGRASKPIRRGVELRVSDDFVLRVDGRNDDETMLVTILAEDPWACIERHGHVPLPPYLQRDDEPSDRERYQTVYAASPGAVAAPTAGLHLTAALLDRLRSRNVDVRTLTLHVGLGTFLPVKVARLDDHVMHLESYWIPAETARAVRNARAEGRAIVAVGTTTVRSLEAWGGGDGPLAGETSLLIQPGHSFRVVDAILTNFHLPRSTLLALVMAFAGVETIRRAYAEAVRERYRFFSYGDAMLLVPNRLRWPDAAQRGAPPAGEPRNPESSNR